MGVCAHCPRFAISARSTFKNLEMLMARSHSIALGACPPVLAFLVAACSGAAAPQAAQEQTEEEPGDVAPENRNESTTEDAGAAETGPRAILIDPNAAGGV